MYTVLGFVRRSGEYEGRPYDNMMVFCQVNTPSPDVTGMECETLKIPYAVFVNAKIAEGSVITPYRDKYGRIADVIIR